MINDLRNWLEQLGAKIPGYEGYVDRERRRDLDKLYRENLANRLRGIKTPISDVIRELSSTGRLMEVGPVDRLLKKIDQIENRVRFASYGYSGFFDAAKIEEPELESIYQFDLALAAKIDAIENRSRGLKATLNGGELKAAASEIESAIDDLNQTFDKRYRAINDFNQNH